MMPPNGPPPVPAGKFDLASFDAAVTQYNSARSQVESAKAAHDSARNAAASHLQAVLDLVNANPAVAAAATAAVAAS